uniref:Lipocalin/cytosolic fatty-acid binding domain-containing protein n=1 Tax=Castor canadensis TaxID=51338 RepID=A0A8C0X884_CASCN
MKTLFLTVVLLGLVAALQFGLLQLEGTWYVKAMVTTKNLTERKVPWEAFPVTLTALEGGKFEVTNTIMYNGQCRKKKVLMQKTEEPGKYTDCESGLILYIEELPEMNHTIFYCECQHHRKTFYVAKLMGEGPKDSVSSHLAPPPQGGAPRKTHRPWKNLRNSYCARDSHRMASLCLSRKVRGGLCPHPSKVSPLCHSCLPMSSGSLCVLCVSLCSPMSPSPLTGTSGSCFGSWSQGLSCGYDGVWTLAQGVFSHLGFSWFLQKSAFPRMTRVSDPLEGHGKAPESWVLSLRVHLLWP